MVFIEWKCHAKYWACRPTADITGASVHSRSWEVAAPGPSDLWPHASLSFPFLLPNTSSFSVDSGRELSAVHQLSSAPASGVPPDLFSEQHSLSSGHTLNEVPWLPAGATLRNQSLKVHSYCHIVWNFLLRLFLGKAKRSSQSQRTKTAQFNLYVVSKTVRLTKARTRMEWWFPGSEELM